MNPATITPVVLTWNEEPNIRRCLERLTWAREVIVVDSGSTDRTVDICEGFPNVRVVKRDFDCHSNQWNAGIDETVTPWVLGLDADFVLPHDTADLFSTCSDFEHFDGFRACFRYLVVGRPLRGTLYPPKTVLFRRDHCRYVQDGHTQLLTGDGRSGLLPFVIDHDDRKPLARWLESQRKYAILEADKLLEGHASESLPDRLRRMIWPAVPASLFFTLFAKRVILDGWPGWYYAFQRTYAELLLSLELLDRKLKFDPQDD
jgi:glycosyltransferase involved in cell wall biosynthesis